ncbi:helix-turn-helix transcriptional regulator [Synechococcus sp. BS55D]|uniref:helix-turn-helix transcriptional regulator n=1 Tax=Synechococcus sp. BS55D TaxID=2055943 RepID=UPI00103977B7|nr:helix-turn-helix transcriptional regulator [Synechococcus sp. BS55D]
MTNPNKRELERIPSPMPSLGAELVVGPRELELVTAAVRGRRSVGLDDLVDFIHAQGSASLSLSDLERRSGYSSRQLQRLFRARFDCTPMQFVRRTRLEEGLRLLQIARAGDSVVAVSRSIGYRSASALSADFQRRYGMKPSMVLRQPKL